MEQHRYQHDYSEDRLTESQRQNLPVYMDMMAEYESSEQYLADELQIMFDQDAHGGQMVPNTRHALSPLQRPTLTRAMSNELEAISLGPTAINMTFGAIKTTFGNASASSTNTTNTDAPQACPMSPKIQSRPPPSRPTPSPNNPWYWEDRSPDDVEAQLSTILHDVHNTLSTWICTLSPEAFVLLATRSLKNWDRFPDQPHLRKLCDGLAQMREFLICGPSEWMLSRALSLEGFESLENKAGRANDALRSLLNMRGCPGWIDEEIGQPLRAIEQLLGQSARERAAWKKEGAKGDDELAAAVQRMEME